MDNYQKKAVNDLQEALDQCDDAGLVVIGIDSHLAICRRNQF